MAGMTPKQRLMTALRNGTPDRVPCSIATVRWSRYHCGCTCPLHQLKVAEDFGLDGLVSYGSYVWKSISNDYIYAPGGGYSHSATGLYGDLPGVNVELRIENCPEHVWYYRTFHTPAGTLRDVIQWARPNAGYGDGPNPHRVEPLVKTLCDLEALRYLYPPPRRDLIEDIPIILDQVGERGVVAALDCTHGGSWGVEALGPEGMLIASVAEPELLKNLCRMAEDVHVRNLRAMLQRGIEVVVDSWFQCGLSAGLPLKTFQSIFLPLIRETSAAAHEYGALYAYYDAGKMSPVLPLLLDAGVDVIYGLQPPDIGDVNLKEVKHEYGSRVALMGGLDSVYVFDMGTPEKVRSSIRQAIADGGANGGFILDTAMSISPETPADSLAAAAQAAKDYGVYGRDLATGRQVESNA